MDEGDIEEVKSLYEKKFKKVMFFKVPLDPHQQINAFPRPDTVAFAGFTPSAF